MGWWKFYFFLFSIMALLFKAKAVYVAFYAVALFHFGVRYLLRLAFSRLKVQRSTDKTRLFRGEIANIHLQIVNGSLIPLAWLSGCEHIPTELSAGRPQSWVLSLKPKSASPVSYSISGRNRGLYRVGPIDLSIGDPFGLHTESGRLEVFHDVVVYPNIYPLTDLGLPSQLPFGNVKEPRRLYPDPSRLAGVRPYQAGDTPRSIHWKATARAGGLQVKLFEHTISLDTAVFLNMNEQDYAVQTFLPDSELAVETAASLANYLAMAGEPFALITNAGQADTGGVVPETYRIPSQKGMVQLTRVLEVLAAARCRPAGDFASLLHHEARCFTWGATLLIVTPVDTDTIVDSALSLTRAGYKVLLFVTGRSVQHTRLLKASYQSPLQAYHVVKDSAIHLEKEA